MQKPQNIRSKISFSKLVMIEIEMYNVFNIVSHNQLKICKYMHLSICTNFRALVMCKIYLYLMHYYYSFSCGRPLK